MNPFLIWVEENLVLVLSAAFTVSALMLALGALGTWTDEDVQVVERYLEEQPMSTVHAIAQPVPWPEFGRPTTFVVDRQGIVRRSISASRDYPRFVRLVEEYL